MVVTLIGTGRLGTNLHAALCKAGHEVKQLQGRHFSPSEVVGDVVVICVKDDAISLVAKALSDVPMLVVHTAGSVDADVLNRHRRGVFYPMQTFSKERLVEFDDIPIFIEAADEEDMKTLEQLAKSISRKTYRLDSEGRKYLHLAAVFACNFTNHCYDLADEILSQHGIPFDVMLPLIDQTARKVHHLSPRQAQTGPAARNDKTVIAQHEALLKGKTKDIYNLISQNIYDKLRLKED